VKKEIGISKNASKAAKALDEKVDKKHGVAEGSKADLKLDKKINHDDKARKLKGIEKY
jgi:hypothetical protein